METPIIAEGKATRYNPGVMEQVVANRLRWGQLNLDRPHAGYVALADCKYLNRMVSLEIPGQGSFGPFLVADCGAEEHQQYLQDIGFAVDLSWQLAVRFGAVQAPIRGVKVFLHRPAVAEKGVYAQ